MSNVLKVCDVRVGVLHCPSLCGCRFIIRMKKIHCTYPWLLVLVVCFPFPHHHSSLLCSAFDIHCLFNFAGNSTPQ